MAEWDHINTGVKRSLLVQEIHEEVMKEVCKDLREAKSEDCEHDYRPQADPRIERLPWICIHCNKSDVGGE